ncbi:MAG: Hsp20/alpha crystallin family protein [Desulfocapsa sp.]|nr:Hsp20/alpha crystallin family protein [Desulfocapsa sp.]MBN4048601.1 Hsp20/alpha crystallin family protein [bacterium AH-315-N22]MBN4052829.1 Hsp20/alpha crystallin family protein [bacterium AH-315-K15]MBN4058723.1 Hsp20/alpha crystallin family protein [Desulfocapsa sp. AH-315-J15]
MSETAIATRKESMPEKRADIATIAPVVDIHENNEEILLHADMPGVVRENLTVHIDNGTLDISGIREIKKHGAADWEEFGDVEYRRTFSVPQTIDIEKIDAELKNGVLELRLPKSEAAKPRMIEIRKAA